MKFRAMKSQDGKFRYHVIGNAGIPQATGACVTCPGHDTEQEAYDHQKRHLVATASVEYVDPAGPCAAAGCSATSRKILRWGAGDMFVHLCDAHSTKQELAKHVKVEAMEIGQ